MAWLIKQRSGIFYVRYYDARGTAQQRSTRTRDRKTADEILKLAERQIALGRFGGDDEPDGRTVGEAWREFMTARNSDWKPETRKLYDWTGKRLCAKFGESPLDDLRGEAIQALASAWRAKNELSDSSTQIWIRHVRAFLSYCHERGWCDKIRVRIPRVRVKAERVRVLTGEEIARLLRACDDPEARTLFQVMLLTGARLGHACALRWADVFWTQGILYLRAEHGKGGKPHEIELFPELSEILREYGQNRAQTGDLFRFGPWRARALFERARQSAGLPKGITPHGLRHTAAAGWLARGVPIYDVSKLLNHSSVAVTEKHYGHLQRGRQKAWLGQSAVVDAVKSVRVDMEVK